MKREAFLLAVALACASATTVPTPSASQFNLGTSILNWSGLDSSGDSLNYAGVHGAWTYTMPSGVVLGVNGVYSPSLTNTGSSSSLASGLSHIEARVGMQMTAPNGMPFTPYISLGQHQVSYAAPAAASKSATSLLSSTQALSWQYTGLGVMGSYALAPSVSVGYNAKVLGHLSAKQTASGAPTVDLGSTWGYEVSAPITISTSDASTSVVVEPGMTKLDASASGQIMHAKVSLQKSF